MSDAEQDYHDNFIPCFDKNIYKGGQLTNEFKKTMIEYLKENNHYSDGKVHVKYVNKYSEMFGKNVTYTILADVNEPSDAFGLSYIMIHPGNYTSEAIIRAVAYRVLN